MSSPGDPRGPQRQHRGFGAFPQPEPPRPKRRGWLITAVVLGAVVLLGAMAAVVVVGFRGQDAPPEPAAAPATSSGATPLVPGWQVVDVPKRQAVYDVPQDWERDPNPDAVHAVGPPGDAIGLTGVAHRQRGFCPGDDNSFRAMTGAGARLGPDDNAVAAETAATFIGHAFTRDGHAPTVEQSPPEPLTLTGGVPAARVNAQVTLPAPTGCDARAVAVSVVATNSDGRSSVVLVSAADQGIPNAVTPAALDRVTASLRPR
ncbi:hypothetical protein REH65_23825 [Saccharopolyspora sp. ID03-671]|uniref:hypothetical protein n=1 Tax=Saccharopolyspora sp. ID03-671 TaxID=3073066 RepID=UPI00324A7775